MPSFLGTDLSKFKKPAVPAAGLTAPAAGLPPLIGTLPGAIGGESNGMPPGFAEFAKQLSGSRDADLKGGMDFFGKYFGNDNPEMKAVMDARKAAAFGPDTQTALARQAGTEGINRSLQTAMRQFQGAMPASGVRGGAAGAMGGIMARGALDNTRGLERDLALNAMDRRTKGLADYEHTLTGERAGLLGSAFGNAGLGAQDRNSALGFLTSSNWLDQAKAERDATNGIGGGGDSKKPWYQPSFNPLDPRYTNPTGAIADKALGYIPGYTNAKKQVTSYIPSVGGYSYNG